MKKSSLSFLFILLSLSICAWAGDLKKPTRVPAEITPEQKVLLQEGITLHNQGDNEGAIKKYESILAANPDSVEALYEMGLSYFANKNYKKALEVSEKGAEYNSKTLPQLYIQIANCWDQLDETEKAIDIYKKTLKEFPKEPLLHYNLALTYYQNKKQDMAISLLKEELHVTPGHPTSHLLLGLLFKQNGYQIPAIFALSRFLILEPRTGRSVDALANLRQLINAGVVAKNEKNIQINFDPNAKKDEGDFGPLLVALSMASAGRFLEKNKDKTPLEKEVDQFKTFLDIMLEMVERDKGKLKFTGAYYVPYFVALQKQGHSDAFVYWIHAGSKEQDVQDWLQNNAGKVADFLAWSKQYQWPQNK
jgi:tetratricopeptide (TPR) repeat protein